MDLKSRQLILLCLICFSSLRLAAQQYPNNQYTTAEGLPNNSIRALYIDSRDMLWVGTENGVSVRDNGKFRNFTKADGLAFNSCWAIAEDQKGNIWFGSYGGGLSFFDGEKFTAFGTAEDQFDGRIRTIFPFEHNLFIGTENGIAAINTSTLTVETYPESILESEQNYVSGFFEHGGKLYYTTYGEGVYEVNTKTETNRIKKINDQSFIYAFSKFGNDIFTSNKGFIDVHNTDDLINGKQKSNSFGKSIIWDYEKLPNGDIYAAGWGIFNKDGGVFQLVDGKLLPTDQKFNVSSKEISQLAYNQKVQKLFIGTRDMGLFSIRLNEGILYHPFDEKDVFGIQRLGNTEFILHEGGLTITELQSKKHFSLSRNDFKNSQENYFKTNPKQIPKYEDDFFELNPNTPSDLIEFYGIKKERNQLWINTNIGLYSINQLGKIIAYLPIHTYQFSFTSTGQLVETNPYGGVRIYEDLRKMKYRYYSKDDPTTPTQVIGIASTQDKLFFASVFTGLYGWDGSRFISYLKSGIWAERKFKHIHSFQKNKLVLATEFESIYIIEVSPKFKILTEIPRNKIIGKNVLFLESTEDILFIATEAGINIYQNGDVRLLNQENGLKQILKSQVNCLNGKLYAPAQKGYYTISISDIIETKTSQFDIGIEKLVVNYKPVPESDFSWFRYQPKTLKLPYDKNTIYLDIKPIGSTYPEKLQYRYRLKASDPWSPFTKEKKLAFPYLPVGNYTLEIEAMDAQTGAINLFKLLDIRIDPPFCQNPLGIGLFILFVMISSSIIFEARIRNYRQQEHKRNAIQNRLNDLKIEALRSQMNPHFIFNAINSIQYYILKNDEDNAIEFLGKFSKLMRKTLENSSKKFVTIQEDIEYLQAYIEIENQRIGNKLKFNINFDFINSEQELTLLKNYLIPPMLTQPFVENAFVHAFGEGNANPSLSITFFEEEEGLLRCEIVDNGKGIQEQKKSQLHESKSLQMVEDRVRLMIQRDQIKPIKLESLPGKGTKVTVIIPYKKAPLN